jgi:two-component system OmpR family response regulator/two-component system response regulator QseB
MRILLVEDDDLLGEGLKLGLKQAGFVVDWVKDGRSAQLAIETETFAAMVLDLGLPRMSGTEVLTWLRSNKSPLPVLVLTARDTLEDRIGGLDAGADDYLVKPCDLGELAARLRALIRRSSGQPVPVIQIGPLTVCPQTHAVNFRGNPVDLAAKEFALLHELARDCGKVLSKNQLAQRLYAWGEEIESNAIEVHVHHLRRKLGPEVIITIRGVGYLLPKELA